MLSLANRDLFKQLLEAQYLAKFLRQLRFRSPIPPLPIPDPGQFELQPSLSIDARDVLLGDLIVSALGDPHPQPSRPLFINQIRESGLHIEVIKDLIVQFEDGVKALREELETFEKADRC